MEMYAKLVIEFAQRHGLNVDELPMVDGKIDIYDAAKLTGIDMLEFLSDDFATGWWTRNGFPVQVRGEEMRLPPDRLKALREHVEEHKDEIKKNKKSLLMVSPAYVASVDAAHIENKHCEHEEFTALMQKGVNKLKALPDMEGIDAAVQGGKDVCEPEREKVTVESQEAWKKALDKFVVAIKGNGSDPHKVVILDPPQNFWCRFVAALRDQKRSPLAETPIKLTCQPLKNKPCCWEIQYEPLPIPHAAA